jgi:Zn-dependent peptidase ImmA (M78 family)
LAQAKWASIGEWDVFPVDPWHLAKREGIHVLSATFRDPLVSVRISKLESGNCTIYVSEIETLTRQRFAIAYALGYLFLHIQSEAGSWQENRLHESMCLFTDGGSGGNKERDASRFAACLLIPEAMVRDLYWTGASIRDMSKLLDVSPICMLYRLESMGLWVG